MFVLVFLVVPAVVRVVVVVLLMAVGLVHPSPPLMLRVCYPAGLDAGQP